MPYSYVPKENEEIEKGGDIEIRHLRRVGKSYSVIIPKSWLDDFRLKEGDEILQVKSRADIRLVPPSMYSPYREVEVDKLMPGDESLKKNFCVQSLLATYLSGAYGIKFRFTDEHRPHLMFYSSEFERPWFQSRKEDRGLITFEDKTIFQEIDVNERLKEMFNSMGHLTAAVSAMFDNLLKPDERKEVLRQYARVRTIMEQEIEWYTHNLTRALNLGRFKTSGVPEFSGAQLAGLNTAILSFSQNILAASDQILKMLGIDQWKDLETALQKYDSIVRKSELLTTIGDEKLVKVITAMEEEMKAAILYSLFNSIASDEDFIKVAKTVRESLDFILRTIEETFQGKITVEKTAQFLDTSMQLRALNQDPLHEFSTALFDIVSFSKDIAKEVEEEQQEILEKHPVLYNEYLAQLDKLNRLIFQCYFYILGSFEHLHEISNIISQTLILAHPAVKISTEKED